MRGVVRVDTKFDMNATASQMAQTQRYKVQAPVFEHVDPSVKFTQALSKHKDKIKLSFKQFNRILKHL